MMKLKKMVLGLCFVSAHQLHAEPCRETPTTPPVLSDDVANAIEQHLSTGVKQQERKQFTRGVRCQSRGYKKTDGKIYLLPNWPAYTVFFRDNDLIQTIFKADFASQAYSGHGGTEGLPSLIFGEGPLRIQDILLASKLLIQGVVQSVNTAGVHKIPQDLADRSNYLSILANQQLVFGADANRYQVSIDYGRHFRKGDLTLGVHIPVVMKYQRLRLLNDISDDNFLKITRVRQGRDPGPGKDAGMQVPGLEDFTDLQFPYANLEAFVSAIFAQNDIAFNHSETTADVSDVSAYLNLDVRSRYFARFVTGVSFTLPTAPDRNMSKLWDWDIGNGGFFQMALYGSWLWQINRWCNPYLHARGTVGFPANVNRRVPNIVLNAANQTLNGTTPVAGQVVDSLIPFGKSLRFPALPNPPVITSSLTDTTLRNVAAQAIKVKINPGPEFFMRVGNTFDAIGGYKGFLDISYDLTLKGKDYVVNRLVDSSFVTNILTQNSWRISHLVMGNYSYQFDEHYRARAGVFYVFAGRNTLKSAGFELAFNAEF